MAEIKQNFSAGKMNKDLDERLLPKGQYRHAENIQVSTSEDSDVGAIENILSNTKLSNIESLALFVINQYKALFFSSAIAPTHLEFGSTVDTLRLPNKF